ncbi:hypothetical protein H0O00_04970 [Candidatus Micrarchaeota archaeon]|nr:hypothetical protein [Candidatus Micrarchaeota archaeon]
MNSHQLRHIADSGPQDHEYKSRQRRDGPFGLIVGLRELNYRRTVRQMDSADQRLERLKQEHETLKQLVSAEDQAGRIGDPIERDSQQISSQHRLSEFCDKQFKSESWMAKIRSFTLALAVLGVPAAVLITGAYKVLPYMSVPPESWGKVTSLLDKATWAVAGVILIGATVYSIAVSPSQKLLKTISARMKAEEQSLRRLKEDLEMELQRLDKPS